MTKAEWCGASVKANGSCQFDLPAQIASVEQAFDAEKAVQVAAKFIELNGGSVNRYALIKMMYEADREACRLWSRSMTGDQPYSMRHGPVLSQILNLTKGEVSADASIWREFINPVDSEDMITLVKDVGDKDLLSKKELSIIETVYQRLGSMSFKELKEYSHSHAEYESTAGAKRISHEARLSAVGKTAKQITVAKEELSEDAILRLLKG